MASHESDQEHGQISYQTGKFEIGVDFACFVATAFSLSLSSVWGIHTKIENLPSEKEKSSC